jgi:23S rRNA (cytidine1920-2'-O)/16S rRNA (cytidine1409-2'-O)-methyltransferase
VPVDKAGTRVAADAVLRIKGAVKRFVSRGGDKLAGALADLHIDPTGLSCLDVGASTGGFTDCLLQSGARGVAAVDVGYGQLAEKLRQDSRVTVLEKTNARQLDASKLPTPVDLVVADVSFISLRLLLPAIAGAAPGAIWLLMVKPQFEVGIGKVGKGGVVRDPRLRAEAADGVAAAAADCGYLERGRADSQLPGPKGNREVFLHLTAAAGDDR